MVRTAKQKGYLYYMDVFNAFMQGDLNEEVYMDIPREFCKQEETDNLVCRLQKSLYGLKQTSKQWNAKLTKALVKDGYSQSLFDDSLFTKRCDYEIVALLVYVDDRVIKK